MSFLETAGLRVLKTLEPETAHGMALKALRAGVGTRWQGPFPQALRIKAMGLEFAHPLGLAAGFDKNAEAISPLLNAGFSFVEVGAITPKPQPGNPRPRLFRLPEDGAVINRFGFNNEGMEAAAARLARAPNGIIGVNLGANKDSEDRAADYGKVLRCLGPYVSFATVNVSSPNTQGLRGLQEKDLLSDLLYQTKAVRDEICPQVKLLLKIAPDLTAEQLEDVAKAAMETRIDGIIATNTTLSREGLKGDSRDEAGGLSGRPLFERSTEVLRELTRLTNGGITLIGVGGVASAEDAYAKIRAGASLVQLYTALSYQGPGLIREIVEGLPALLARDGFETLPEAIGADVT